MPSPIPALDLDQAQARVLADAEPLAAHAIAAAEAVGGVLAQTLVARWQLPLGDTSTMDGFAVGAASLAAEGTVSLRRRGESAAGRPTSDPLGRGEAARISTGALLPPGADAVLAQEEVSAAAGTITVDCRRLGPVAPGRFVRAAGSEIAAGEPLLEAGTRLTATHVALLAGAGHPAPPIHRRPEVAILCTGDELIPLGGIPAPGQVISTNGLMLRGLLGDLGIVGRELPPLADDRQATRDGLAALLGEVDVLLTSGGISVGDHDHVGAALGGLGLEPCFTRLNLRPGRPLTFGRLGRTWVFALPGNPASAYVTFELVVRPLLCVLLGLPPGWGRPRSRLRLGAPAPGAGGRLHVVRARVTGGLAEPLPQQGSGSLRSVVGHHALLLVPPGPGLPAGAEVEAILVAPEEIRSDRVG